MGKVDRATSRVMLNTGNHKLAISRSNGQRRLPLFEERDDAKRFMEHMPADGEKQGLAKDI